MEQNKEKARELAVKLQETVGTSPHSFEAIEEILIEMAKWKDEQLAELPVYVIMRYEEHDDYVEDLYIDKCKAEKYCKQFEGKDDEYSRDYVERRITL